MNGISTAPLVQAIGWTLLHLVWEGFLVGAILAAVLGLLQRRSANARYLASCAALLLLVTLGAITAVRVYEPAMTPLPGTSAIDPLSASAFTAVAVETFSWIGFAAAHLAQIVLIWLAGVLILSARLVASWIGAHRLARRRAHDAPAQWEESLRRIASALDVRRPIRLLESAAVEVPAVVGWLRPCVLLPVASLSGLSLEQIEMILAHELAHIRRHDFIVNVMQSVVETLLFFHPAVWWISRRIRIEREHCCDDLAVSLFGDPLQYAHALTRFEELRMDAHGVLAATGGSLLGRVRRLVAGSAESSGWASRWAAGGALLTVFAVLLVAPSLPLFASHDPQNPPKAVKKQNKTDSKAPAAGIAGGVKDGVAEGIAAGVREGVVGGVIGGVVGGVEGGIVANTTTCSGTVVDVDADGDDADDADDAAQAVVPEPPQPQVVLAPPAPAAPRPPRVSAFVPPLINVAPIVQESMALAQRASADAMRNLDLSAMANMKLFHHKIGLKGKLSVDDLIELKSLNVTPKYIEAMRDSGIGPLSLDDLASLRMAGVTPDYVREMKDAGYSGLSAEDLIRMRMQGLTPDFVRSLAEAGYRDLPVKDLLRLRMMGVDADFIRELSRYRTK